MHKGATTTPEIRAAIQASREPVRLLAERFGINPKTVMKWKHRGTVHDRPAGNRRAETTRLTPPEQEMCLAFRKATLLPLDDCLYALQLSLPHLNRAGLHRLYRKHGISRLETMDSLLSNDNSGSKSTIGYFNINAAPVKTAEGIVYMVAAFDLGSRVAYAELYRSISAETVTAFLSRLIAATPYRISAVLTGERDEFESDTDGRTKDRFAEACERYGIRHELLPKTDLWNINQSASAKRMTGADRGEPHYESFDHIRTHFFAFFDTYNFTRRLKALSGKTPHEFVCACWNTQPELFRFDPAGWIPKLVP